MRKPNMTGFLNIGINDSLIHKGADDTNGKKKRPCRNDGASYFLLN